MFGFPEWGGARDRCGRRPKGEKAGHPHRGRPALAPRYPVHVTAKIVKSLPSLRRKREFMALFHIFERAYDKNGMRLIHYSVQGNHIHLIIEAKNASALTRGMQGLCVRIAKRLNKLWQRRGQVFAERYHAHILKTPREVKHALNYVLKNAYKHKQRPREVLDPFSSARWFDGWNDRGVSERYLNPLATAKTWLLNFGWRYHGLLSPQPSG